MADSSVPPSEADITFIHTLSDPIAVVDQRGVVHDFNPALHQLLSTRRARVERGVKLFDIAPSLKGRLEFPLPEYATEMRIAAAVKGHGASFQLFPFAYSERHVLVVRNEETLDLMQLVLDSIPTRVFWKGLDGNYLGCNRLFAGDCGLDNVQDVIGTNDFDYFPQEEAERFVSDDRKVMRAGEALLNIEEPQTRPDGDLRWLETHKVPIRNHAGMVMGILGSYTDVTERKRHQQQLEHLARRDPLTELPNRLALRERLKHLAEGQRRGGLMYIDLDHFKMVNDSLGHAVGDALLKQVARRLTNVVADRGFVARIGGDEFCVLVVWPDGSIAATRDEMSSIANEIRSALLAPYEVASHLIHLGATIGISTGDASNDVASAKLDEADIAMYEAKLAGRNTVLFYNAVMRRRIDEFHEMQSRLRHAQARDELSLAIQPQFDAKGRLIGGEALLRWDNPELGVVSPRKFIQVAERTGLIHDLGLWVLRRACLLLRVWSSRRRRRLNVQRLSINVSAQQLRRSDFLERVRTTIETTAINPALLRLELTESSLLNDQDGTTSKLNALRDLGLSLAVDDFGTGYSCLSYLSKLPISELKIDQSFVSEITESKRQSSIVEAIIAMSNNLGLDTIAEGVESKAQRDHLLKSGCSRYQGFYFSEPLTALEYEKLLLEHGKPPRGSRR